MKSSLCAILVIAGIFLFFDGFNILSVLFISFAFLVFFGQNKNSWIHLPYFGLANLLTFIRLALVLIFAFFAEKTLIGGTIFNILVLSIPLLDVFDGLIARIRKETSHFGMYFDMEVDAVFVMVSSISIYKIYPSLWIVLIPAFLRYFYKFTIDIFDSEGKFIESKKKYASVFAGTYFVAIIAFFFLQNYWASLFLVLSSGLIIFSFCISFYEFYRWYSEV